MGFRSLCIESNCKCSYSGGYMIVSTSESVNKIHLSEIQNIMFSTYKAFVSARLMAELAKNNIAVVFCDEKYSPVSQALPLYGSYYCAESFVTQMSWTEAKKKRVWQQIVRHKINKQAEVLKKFKKDEAAAKVHAYSYEVLSGDKGNKEAAAARVYFSALVDSEFTRDMDCYTNAALNYGYAILLSFISREIVSRGYITQSGISHMNRANEWNLSCDLMEPFRPFVDLQVMKSEVQELTTEMKHNLQKMFTQDVKFDDGVYKMNSVISIYIQQCFRALRNEINPSEIKIYNLL